MLSSNKSLSEKLLKISVVARESPLSRAQVREVLLELRNHHPNVQFSPTFLLTTGDKDRTTSLRSLNKTNFFTKEVDQFQLSNENYISIHSAKDLPDPIPDGLKIVAITKGLDPSDSLVFREGDGVRKLTKDAVVATSSERREEVVRKLFPEVNFVDIRGNIHQRLSNLYNGNITAVVIAEAALIRLNLTRLNRISLPGSTVPLQGQLAIIAREGDKEMAQLFSSIDVRK